MKVLIVYIFSIFLYVRCYTQNSISYNKVAGRRSSITISAIEEATIVTQDGNECKESTATTVNAGGLYLLSLQWPSKERFSKSVMDVWRWKDSVLGDGRDFFIPKPKTIRALQDYFISCIPSITDCTILSNCARFEIIVVVDNPGSKDPSREISACLLSQIKSYQKRKVQMQIPIDWPALIDPNAHTDIQDKNIEENHLLDYWTKLEGTKDIINHLCLVSSGMASRPQRPERPVIFQPFSSRDAHILLQLKRTLEITNRKGIIAILLKYAIQAGKAVRNPDQVSELLELRSKYGTGNSKYDISPPIEVTQRVANAAKVKVIDPIINECMNSIKAMDYAMNITIFRTRALDLAVSDDEIQFIQQLLHEPTIRLRNGDQINEQKFNETLSIELRKRRQES